MRVSCDDSPVSCVSEVILEDISRSSSEMVRKDASESSSLPPVGLCESKVSRGSEVVPPLAADLWFHLLL